MQLNVLTSWKEIAAYMGKGVRTVQRWETEMGLPVRRPGPDRHIVLAFPAELDQWAHNQLHPKNTQAGREIRRSSIGNGDVITSVAKHLSKLTQLAAALQRSAAEQQRLRQRIRELREWRTQQQTITPTAQAHIQ